MPYLGILDENKRELKAVDYFRLDMSDIYFKISPALEPKHTFTILNVSPIRWPIAKVDWGWFQYLAVFDEVDGGEFRYVVYASSSRKKDYISLGSQLAMDPGRLTIFTVLKSDGV